MTLAGVSHAADTEKKPCILKLVEKKSDLKEEVFMCAVEIYVLDAKGVKIKTLLFSAPNAANQLDCLGLYSAAVGKVEAGLSAGQTTAGTVSYLK